MDQFKKSRDGFLNNLRTSISLDTAENIIDNYISYLNFHRFYWKSLLKEL